MIIIGVDPGTNVTGYGVVALQNHSCQLLDYGCITPPLRYKITDRYLVIFEAFLTLLEQFKPQILSIETQFVHKNVQSAIKLGMARGVVVVAAKKHALKVMEYTPTKAKKAVTGNGRASKGQVQMMVQKLLNLTCLPEPEDAADALALALCHAHSEKFSHRIGTEI